MTKSAIEFQQLAVDLMLREAESIVMATKAVGCPAFERLVEQLVDNSRKAVVTGVGKSAIAARKIAATLATVGRQAVFVDPIGLFHGELGLLRPGDVAIMVSQSGGTEELTRLIGPLEQSGVVLYAITGDAHSILGEMANAIVTGVSRDPFFCVPTASSAAAVAVGDAVAIAVASITGFGDDVLRRTHPGGAIGSKYLG